MYGRIDFDRNFLNHILYLKCTCIKHLYLALSQTYNPQTNSTTYGIHQSVGCRHHNLALPSTEKTCLVDPAAWQAPPETPMHTWNRKIRKKDLLFTPTRFHIDHVRHEQPPPPRTFHERSPPTTKPSQNTEPGSAIHDVRPQDQMQLHHPPIIIANCFWISLISAGFL